MARIYDNTNSRWVTIQSDIIASNLVGAGDRYSWQPDLDAQRNLVDRNPDSDTTPFNRRLFTMGGTTASGYTPGDLYQGTIFSKDLGFEPEGTYPSLAVVRDDYAQYNRDIQAGIDVQTEINGYTFVPLKAGELGNIFDYSIALTTIEQQKADAYLRRVQENPTRWFTIDVNGNVALKSTSLLSVEQQSDLSDNLAGYIQSGLLVLKDSIPVAAVTESDLGDLDFGFGGGGGYSGPEYVAPDRRVIEDTVKAMLVTLTGDHSEQRVSELTDLYLDDHGKQWNIRTSGGVDIDPNQSVLEAIRSQSDYQSVHTDRPDSSDEMRWVGERNQQLQALGLNPGDAAERAVQMAQGATGLADISTGAFQFSKGRKDITMMSKIGRSAAMVARSI